MLAAAGRGSARLRPRRAGRRFAEGLGIVVCGLLPGGGSAARFVPARPRRASLLGAKAAAAIQLAANRFADHPVAPGRGRVSSVAPFASTAAGTLDSWLAQELSCLGNLRKSAN